MLKKSLLTPIMLAAGMAVATPAHADDLNRHKAAIDVYEAVGSRSVRVSIADLDLNSGADHASLKRRIDHAVENVCDRDGQPFGLKKTAYVHCVRDAWADALNQVDRAVAIATNSSGPAGAAGMER
jgi:UrcA family protein